jgi:hypothetical protein
MIQAEQLNKDLMEMRLRKDQALQGFHQILGAISILEQLIQRTVNGESIEDVPSMDSVEKSNGEANEQAAQ